MSQPRRKHDSLECLHQDMEQAHLIPTWKYVSEFVAASPRVSYQPFLWKWQTVYEHLRRAGELITPARGAERRSMEHVNPDLRAQYTTSHTLATALQLVKAGERAPSHRHQAAAIRFVVQSHGGQVFTRVQGEPLLMEEHDLLLTPLGMWHDHVNDTPHDIIWLDALDYPLVNLLQCSYFEPGEAGHETPAKEAGYTAKRMGHVRPLGWHAYPEEVPVMRYPWRDTCAALDALRHEPGSPFDGVIVEYINPVTSGPTLPTMSCRAQLLRPGEWCRSQRSTSSKIYYVMRGTGQSIIDGQQFDWEKGDVFVVPNWAWHEHRNPGREDCLLFSVTDQPVMEVLGMYRQEGLRDDGHQRVTGVFQP